MEAAKYIEPMFFRRLAKVIPCRCAVCARWPAPPVCGPCLERFATAVPRCRRCALRVPAGVAECGRCRTEPPPLAACHVAVDWAYPWSGLIARFKYQDRPGNAGPLAALLAGVPGVQPALDQATHVLAMPLSRERLAERGFNQALQLARALAPRKARPGLLLRIRDTAPQRALDRAERMANVRGAFAADPLRAHELRGATVVLVDDVMTSGASLFAAAAALRAAGAARVTALAIARTP
jgi:ComF family protein